MAPVAEILHSLEDVHCQAGERDGLLCREANVQNKEGSACVLLHA